MRPEDIIILPKGTEETNADSISLDAEVSGSEYNGSFFTVTLQTEYGEIRAISTRRPEDDQVMLSIPKEKIKYLK